MSKASRRRARRARAKERSRSRSFSFWKPKGPLTEPVSLELFSSYPKQIERLLWMLSTARPHRSTTEEAFIKTWIDSLPGMQSDQFGNRFVKIGDAPIVAWTCHTDTVHSREGWQTITVEDDFIGLADSSEANCLGADDTAGVWLMHEMIKANKEGLYIFHRAEELGGLGSQWIVKHNPALVEGIQIMISLDRKGQDSIITEQVCGMCASNKFALSLAAQLGEPFKADPTGMYTDSAFYTDIVAECSNLSVGYAGQHTGLECQNWVFLAELLEKLLKLDYSKLAIDRKPGDYGDIYGFNYGRGYHRFSDTASSGGWGDNSDNDWGFAHTWDSHLTRENAEGWKSNHPNGTAATVDDGVRLYQGKDDFEPDLVRFIERHPEAVAQFLRDYGYDVYDVAEYASVDVKVS